MIDMLDVAQIDAALTRCDVLRWAKMVLRPLGMAPAAHHRLLIKHLQDVLDGRCDRLMVMMPPGSSKSTYASVIFPALFMARWPGEPVVGASHTSSLAELLSGRVQALVREYSPTLGYGLATEAKDRWQTTTGNDYRAIGVGGPLSGQRASLVVIDDAVRSRADAESETIRDKTWNWYNADVLTRLKPGGRVVVISTRWHELDLAGRLLEVERDRWTVLSLPALAEAGDALGRAIGEPLWADDAYGYGAELLLKRASYEAAGQMSDWWSLYQQSPRTPGGGLFQTAKIGTVDALEPGGRSVRGWDLASTREASGRDPDWTVGTLVQRTAGGLWVVADMVRLRGGPAEVEQAICRTAERDGRGVVISLPQDPGQAGKSQVAYLTRQLAGWPVISSVESGDKVTRAAPFAAQVSVGNVSMLRGSWNRPFLDELAGFPNASHDDVADSGARAFNALTVAAEPSRRVFLPVFGR